MQKDRNRRRKGRNRYIRGRRKSIRNIIRRRIRRGKRRRG
jgi:hypothetical protein